jgi:hypothetical protein
MTLYPRWQEDLTPASEIIKHLAEVLDGSKFLDDINVPKNWASIVETLTPTEAKRILQDAGM